MLRVLVDHADLLDSHEVAELLGLSSHRAVSVYAARYADFPLPLVDKGSSRIRLWLRRDVEGWAARHRPER